jgi:hypothetical protein
MAIDQSALDTSDASCDEHEMIVQQQTRQAGPDRQRFPVNS